MARSRKKRRQQVKTERVLPTAERLVKGDVAVAQDNVYRALEPTCLEAWMEKGWLGEGKIATDRFEALQQLLELAEAASLMASNTVDFERVGPGGSSEGADISALDRWRQQIEQCTKTSRSLLTQICCDPCGFHVVDIFDLRTAADELIQAASRKQRERLPTKITSKLSS